MSTARAVDSDPFAGTEMAAVMEQRRVARVERMQRFGASQDQPPVRQPEQRPLWVLPNKQLMWGINKPREAVAALGIAREQLGKAEKWNQQIDQYEQVQGQMDAIEQQERVVREQINEIDQELRQLEIEESSKGRLSKMLGGSRNERRIAELRQKRQPLHEQHRALSYQKSQLSSDLWGVKLYADRQRQDTTVLSRRVELLEALTDRDTAMAERKDRLNARQRGMLDAEREQAAGVFAELKDAGVWSDCAAQRKGRVFSPATLPLGAEAMGVGISDYPGGFPYRMEKQIKSRSNKPGVTPDHSPAPGLNMPGMDSGIDDGIEI
ncbi:hypothetical protein [Corynebacterium evansiae]|uniref:hypothetical protein n=1 Tax=Corynebacterium evansiae TaxID=2913499 RepID=UPI003EB9A83C